MNRMPIGPRIREYRKNAGFTQAELAQRVEISASYLNLIEHDKRLIGGSLLKKIAEQLDVDLSRLSGVGDARLAQDLMEIDQSASLGIFDPEKTMRLVTQSPEWANATLTLHRRYQDASETALALSDRLSQDPALMEISHAVLSQITSIRSFAEILEQVNDLSPGERHRFSSIIANQSDQLGSSAREMITLLENASPTHTPTSPENEVDDFILFHNNYFPMLEDATSRLHDTLLSEHFSLEEGIEERLLSHFKIRVKTGAPNIDRPKLGEADEQGIRILNIPERTFDTTIRYTKARHLMAREFASLIDEMTQDSHLRSEDAKTRAKRALANYAAGCLLLPYEEFLEKAERYRYDIDRLATDYQASFEQIAHRLCTLRREGSEAVPFSFLRSDPAGNLTKPLSTTGLRMPRMGSACPLWVIYQALGRSEPLVQIAEMPQGESYLFVAREVQKKTAIFGAQSPRYSIMLGCDLNYRDRIIYADAFAQDKNTMSTKTGYNCRSCRRSDCAHRAHAAIISA